MSIYIKMKKVLCLIYVRFGKKGWESIENEQQKRREKFEIGN